jgi:hypothetical protein
MARAKAAVHCLPKPTVGLVERKVRAHYRDCPWLNSIDVALAALLKKYPKNTKPNEVLIKAAAINSLYQARVTPEDLCRIADGIPSLGLDKLFRRDTPSADVVHKIGGLGKKKHYSFASKYCSLHDPKSYPIYDSHVDICLWKYRRPDDHVKRTELKKNYSRFVETINRFRSDHELTSLPLKTLDKFLWIMGDGLLKLRKKEKKAVPSSA